MTRVNYIHAGYDAGYDIKDGYVKKSSGISLSKYNIQDYMLLDKENKGWSLSTGFLKSMKGIYTVDVTWKDGKKSMLVLDAKEYKNLVAGMY